MPLTRSSNDLIHWEYLFLSKLFLAVFLFGRLSYENVDK